MRDMREVHVKVCGVTNVADALACVEEGVTAIGLNFVESSPRAIDIETARAIADAVGDRALIVGVVADRGLDELVALRRDGGLGCLQLHGDEGPELVEALLPHAYKAIRVATAEDVARADAYPGAHVLVDAKVTGALGGTGVRVDPSLIVELARRRKVALAGGLTPENVAEAIERVRPHTVDVASGVERAGDPRRKDRDKVHAFVVAVRGALARAAAR